MGTQQTPQGPVPRELGLEAPLTSSTWQQRLSTWSERAAGSIFLWPAILVLLALSIFPLLVSLYMSFARFQLVKGGFMLRFIGLANYKKLLVGSQKRHFLGVWADPHIIWWIVAAVIALLFLYSWIRLFRHGNVTPGRVFWHLLATLVVGVILWTTMHTITPGGRPGTFQVTLTYVGVGLTFQYLLGLGLAMLCAQPLPGRRFFRVVFLLPMMITPVGVAYLFRMLTDTNQGPFQPLWYALGLANFSWVNDPWGARAAVIIGDIWEWTPFMFIVLLAALESIPTDLTEAALVDGANRWQIFRYITWPHIRPVSATLILIRMIEAFKIVDLPNVLTNGGPGTASESMTLQAYIYWRSLDLGGSAAVAYLLLLTVTFVGLAYFNLIHRPATEGS